MQDIQQPWCLRASCEVGGEVMTSKETTLAELEGIAQGPFEPIAIIGMGCLMPDAENIAQFWNNIINAHVSIKEVPSDRWDIKDFWSPGGPGDVEPAKTYAKIGAFGDGGYPPGL